MFKLRYENPEGPKIVKMCDMPPCSIGRVVDRGNYEGVLVMRTASQEVGEVMNLSNPGPDKCWTGIPYTQVRLLKPGEKIVLEVI